MEGIEQNEVAKNYNLITEIWDNNDKWHQRTHKMISKFIYDSLKKIPDLINFTALNAGAGGNSYEISVEKLINIDLAYNRIYNSTNPILANIENMPIKSEKIDLIICVGSVINYCDPIKVISEFKRVLKKDAIFILEFEDSQTLELIGTKNFNKKVVLQDTFYFNRKERLWYFSGMFIKDMLKLHEMKILKTDKCHFISPLVYRITKNENIASMFGMFDSFVKYIPYLNRLSSNTIYFARKGS